MSSEEDLQSWIARQVKQLEGRQISWIGVDGRPVTVHLELKEIELSARPSPTGIGGPTSLAESASIKFLPSDRPSAIEQTDDIDEGVRNLLDADASGATDDKVERLWKRIQEAVFSAYGECNVIPGETGSPCLNRLVVFPEVVAVLARRRRLPRTLERCGSELEALSERDFGICCALWEAARHATVCFTGPTWMNRIIDVRGDYHRVRRACSEYVVSGLRTENWNREDALLRTKPDRHLDGAEVRSSEGSVASRYERITCWAYFLGAIKKLRAKPGAPPGSPEVFLAGRLTRIL